MRLSLGATEFVVLLDSAGRFPFPASRVFPSVSEDDWERMRNWYPDGFVEPNVLDARVTCYLLRQAGRTILVDTGNGASEGGATMGFRGRLLEELRREGVAPEDVDTVFLTHLDPDHSGGCVSGSGESAAPVFARARHFVHRADWELCRRTVGEERSRFSAGHVFPVEKAGLLHVVDDAFDLAEGVRAFPTPGHTFGHMSVWVEGETYSLLIAGDAFYHPLQVLGPHHRFPMDMDSGVAEQTRLRLLEMLREKRALLTACHFPASGVGFVTGNEPGSAWMPLR